MKLARIITLTGLSALASSLLPNNVSSEHNISLANHLGASVDNPQLRVEAIDSKNTPPASDLVQIAGSTWDPKNLATPEAWGKCAGKGSWLTCLFAMSDEEAGTAWPDPLGRTPKSASSQWVGTLETEMRTWGWQQGEFNQEGCEWVTGKGLGREVIEPALKALGLSATAKASGGDNVCYNIEHGDPDAKDSDGDEIVFEEQHYVIDKTTYSCTGASYIFAINHVGGAIIPMMLENPKHAADFNWEDNDPDETNLPQLRRASDLMFAYWLRGNPNPTNLKYYIVNDVRNEETMPILASLLGGKGYTAVPVWPGITLKIGDEDFAKVVSGMPIGATLGHMLLQHKKELGKKYVKEVVIFRDEFKPKHDTPAVQIVYKIEDVPKEEEKPGEKPDEEMPEVQEHRGVMVRHMVRREEAEEENGMLRVHEYRVSRRVEVS